ncbi:MAG: universal stress protein [Gammaproteobacteria bacterium]|jgi:nucleotide-binding universal stress UspA family protein|nr:universal stress protein [Gammaproteobacteria bacterium]
MQPSLNSADTETRPLPRYREILLAVDSSDHANRGTEDAITLARLFGSRITAAHVYAAKMHDLRFRQMEGGLPEQFREEQELERQRDVHDDLITRGLSIIADSYMDQVDRACRAAGMRFVRRALEGKNYRQMSAEANSGNYDLLVLGALGLGAVADSCIGTVCERVVRRSEIDTLVIRSPQRSITDGPLVVAIDGSTQAYGGLLTALKLAQEWQVPLHVVSAFDPYYHYVAFNRIAGVLSEEAGKVFRFQEQEKLHEEIIDSGLAKIYEGHLQIAKRIADDFGVPIVTDLLDGKPYDAILRYLRELDPSLLVIGKLGIHADDALDIGGNAENLLRMAPCAVWLCQRQHRPPVERLAEVNVSWTNEAEARLERAPSFVQNMARIAILRYAQERGHTVVTERIVEEATASLMPGRAEQSMAEIVAAYDAGEIGRDADMAGIAWSEAARAELNAIEDLAVRDNIRLRAEKKARGDSSDEVSSAHVISFVESAKKRRVPQSAPASAAADKLFYWETEALARMARVPEGFMRDSCQQRIESLARQRGTKTVTLELVEEGLEGARTAMASELNRENEGGAPETASKCPFSGKTVPTPEAAEDSTEVPWTAEARARLEEVPAGYCRRLTYRAVTTLARQNDLQRIDLDFLQGVLNTFSESSANVTTGMRWSTMARVRIDRAPESIRGMLIREIESWARREGLEEIDERTLRSIKREWQSRGIFHLDPSDPRHDL